MYGLLTMFITALANRPRGTRWLYWTLCIFFSCVMALMIFMAGFQINAQIVIFNLANVSSTLAEKFNYLVATAEFRDLIIATCSTYLLYACSSFLFFDPWHMICIPQYLILFPTYLNVFMVPYCSNNRYTHSAIYTM